MWLHSCMAGPMTADRCDVTSAPAAQLTCQPTNFCLLLLSAIPYFIYFDITLLRSSRHRFILLANMLNITKTDQATRTAEVAAKIFRIGVNGTVTIPKTNWTIPNMLKNSFLSCYNVFIFFFSRALTSLHLTSKLNLLLRPTMCKDLVLSLPPKIWLDHFLYTSYV